MLMESDGTGHKYIDIYISTYLNVVYLKEYHFVPRPGLRGNRDSSIAICHSFRKVLRMLLLFQIN